MNIDEMTPRKRTYALNKATSLYIISTYSCDSDHTIWQVEFSNGDIDQIMVQSCFGPFDGKAACEREAREIATRQKLTEIT